VVPSDTMAVESLLKDHHAARQGVHELLKFARSEADSIMAKLRQQVGICIMQSCAVVFFNIFEIME